MEIFKKLYKQYNIEYKTLLADVESAKDVKYQLLDNGISIQSMEDTCLFSNTFNEASEEAIKSFLEERLQVCNACINERLKLVG